MALKNVVACIFPVIFSSTVALSPLFSRSRESFTQAAGETQHRRPVVAVLFSGSLRGLRECKDSFYQHVVHANPDMRFLLYGYFGVEDDAMVDEVKKTIKDVYPMDLLEVETDSQRRAHLKRKHPRMSALLGEEKYTTLPNPVSRLHTFQMLQGISAADDLRHGGEYDLVIRTRPDLCFCEDLHLDLALKQRAVYIPWFDSRVHGLAADFFAVGPPDLMSQYASFFSNTAVDEWTNALRSASGPYPEELMWNHLKRQQLSVRKIPNWYASIVHPGKDGRTEYIYPFQKLLRDFKDAARTVPGDKCTSNV